MNGYIITLGDAPLTYTGFRTATAEMPVEAGEQFIASLEGWQLQAFPIPKTCSQMREELAALMATTSLAIRIYFSEAGFTGSIYAALGAGDVALARYYLEKASEEPLANPTMIAAMLALLSEG